MTEVPTLGGSEPTRGLPTPARVLLLFALLYGFLIAIKLMSGSFEGFIGADPEAILKGISNPIAGLAVGILATVIVQSSSTTTAVIVSLVGSENGIPVDVAVPMVLGANIGTTITNTLVSIGSLRRSEEFKRAFAAATVHDFFNLLAVAILLPLELSTGLLSRSAARLTMMLSGGGGGEFKSPIKSCVKAGSKGLEGLMEGVGFEGEALSIATLLLGIAITFFCLIYITRNMRIVIAGRLERAINDALGRRGSIGILVGIVVTVMVQSSSVTTSLLVPMCAAGVLTLRNAFPIMMGANIGTTVTGLLASMAVDRPEGLTIALVHLLFNITGILIFFPVKALREVPVRLALGLSELAVRNRFWIIAYVAGVFVFLPLIAWKLLG